MRHLELSDSDLSAVSGGMDLSKVKPSENYVDCRGMTMDQCTEAMKKADEKDKEKAKKLEKK